MMLGPRHLSRCSTDVVGLDFGLTRIDLEGGASMCPRGASPQELWNMPMVVHQKGLKAGEDGFHCHTEPKKCVDLDRLFFCGSPLTLGTCLLQVWRASLCTGG